MKKFAIFLAFICLFTSLSACKKEVTVSDARFVYTLLDDGTYSVGAKDIYNLPNEIEIPETFQGKLITRISDNAFFKCAMIERVILPDSITSIGQSAFAYSSIEYIYISDELKGIGNGAFGECKSLTLIEYQGNMARWGNILKASNWDIQTYGYAIQCSDGVIN